MNLDRISNFSPVAVGTHSALSIHASGKQTVSSIIQNRTLDEHCIVFVERGSGFFQLKNGIKFVISEPSLIFLVAGSEHTYGPDNQTEWQERWVLFHGVLADAFFENGLLAVNRQVLPIKKTGEFRRLFAELHARPRDGEIISTMKAALSLHELLVCCADLEQKGPIQESICPYEAIVNDIRQNAYNRFSIEALVKDTDMAVSTLRRKCIELTGMSPKNLQNALRIGRAKELLIETDMSIAEIADSIGFTDPYYFSRLFSSRSHCSPTEFRRKYQRS